MHDKAKITVLGVGKIVLYTLLLLGIYYSTITWLLSEDWMREDYSYSWLIPFIVLYMIWERRGDLKRAYSHPSWIGTFVVVMGLAVFWTGELSGEFFALYVSFWMIVVGLCWAHLGWNKLKTILFALIIMLTMFPPPHFVNNKLTLQLKLISSQLGVYLMRLYGMTAYREGNIIDLGFTQLQVVDACSGLRYFFPLIIFGLILAYFYKAALWKRAFLVISTIPISIISNSLRIAMTGVLYQMWGAKVAEGFFHGFSGWIVFMFSIAVLFIEMKFLSFKSEVEKVLSFKSQVLSKEGIPREDSKLTLKSFLRSPQFVVSVLLLGATLALAQGVEFREKIPVSKHFDQFPLQVGQWIGKRQHMEQEIIDTLDMSDYTIMAYQGPAGRSVNFYVAYYESQSKGESIHSPATCLPGSGWIFEKAGKRDIPVAWRGGATMSVNRAFMSRAGYRQLAYYWFPQRDRILTNAYQLKIFNFWDALTRHRTDGALVRLLTPVYENEEVEEADQRLEAFAGEVVPVLEEYLPD